jgi:hypothetical protein
MAFKQMGKIAIVFDDENLFRHRIAEEKELKGYILNNNIR